MRAWRGPPFDVMGEGKDICPFALQLPGPVAKTGYDYGRLHRTHDKTGVTIHTAEYDTSQDEPTLHNALFSGREASWHFTITKEGWLFQHYRVDATTWHCGYPGNLWTVGIECEGYAPDKISGPQYGLLVKLLKWIREDGNWGPRYRRGSVGTKNVCGGLFQHKDWMLTLCQVFSRGMIDAEQLIRDLKEEPMEIQDDFAALRVKEVNCMDEAEGASQERRYQQMRTISAIRHSQHESPDWEMEAWKLLSTVYDAEVAAIREAQERCRVHGRPG